MSKMLHWMPQHPRSQQRIRCYLLLLLAHQPLRSASRLWCCLQQSAQLGWPAAQESVLPLTLLQQRRPDFQLHRRQQLLQQHQRRRS